MACRIITLGVPELLPPQHEPSQKAKILNAEYRLLSRLRCAEIVGEFDGAVKEESNPIQSNSGRLSSRPRCGHRDLERHRAQGEYYRGGGMRRQIETTNSLMSMPARSLHLFIFCNVLHNAMA
jgi:hypothetical protein